MELAGLLIEKFGFRGIKHPVYNNSIRRSSSCGKTLAKQHKEFEFVVSLWFIGKLVNLNCSLCYGKKKDKHAR